MTFGIWADNVEINEKGEITSMTLLSVGMGYDPDFYRKWEESGKKVDGYGIPYVEDEDLMRAYKEKYRKESRSDSH